VLKAGTGSGGLVDSADGSINCGSTCTATVPIGTTITLREYGASDALFAGWSGACTGRSYCMVDINADTTVTATFNTPPRAILTVVKAGDGTGTVTNYGFPMNCSGSTCTQIYSPPGSSVDLNAAAAPGSVFAGWSGGPCTGTGPCRFNIFGDVTVTATFTKSDTPTVGLDVAVLYDQGGVAAGGAQITSSPAGITCGFDNDCSETYTVGTFVTLTIELAGDTTELAGWSGACEGTELTCTIKMDGNKTASAQLRWVGGIPD